MKKIKFIVPIMFILGCAKKEFEYPKIEELKFKPIEWIVPKPHRVELDNGIILYLLEDHELPIINGYIYIKAGSIYDEEDKIGLSEITARTLRTGGTKNRTPAEIDSIIEYTAGSIEFNSGEIAITGSFSFLKENFSELISILADILMNAEFNEEKLNVEIEKLKEEIRRRNESPMEVAFVNFTKKLRKEHPSGWFPTIETVNKIKRKDVIEFYNKFFHPNNIIMAIAGDFNKDSLINEIKNVFSRWQKKEIKFPNIPDLEEKYERKVYYVEKDVKQSTIIMGHLSIYRKDPEFYSLIIGNRILGGVGFTSRLDKKIREEGLAYMVGSYLQPGDFYRGEFVIYCQTEAKNTIKTIELMLQEVENIRSEPVDSSEFYDSKEGIKNGFVFAFESPLDIVKNAAFVEFYNLPKDYYDKYLENIEKVSIESILEAAKNRFLPAHMEILVVGDSTKFDKSLTLLGEIEKISLEE